MNITQSYHDLLKEIEGYEIRINDLKREYEKLRLIMYKTSKPKDIGAIEYRHERVQTSSLYMPLDIIVNRLKKIVEALIPLEELLREKEITKGQIEQKLNEFERLDYKVAYKRDVEGKSLIEIADELGYSYDYIKHVSRRTSIKTTLRTHSTIYNKMI